jgi:hypothetical protein
MSDTQVIDPLTPAPTNAKPVRATTNHERIRLSELEDGGILKLVRNATFISRGQVHSLAKRLKLSDKRSTIDWRLQRLSTIGLLDQLPRIYPFRGAVYTITHAGLQVLEFWNEGLVSITSGSEHLADAIQAPHFLVLNAVHIALSSSPACKLLTWRSDREIASLNYSLPTLFAKDYDAIAEFNVDNRRLTVGIEYERTFKTNEDRYPELRKRLQTETQLNLVLYLTPTKDMILRLLPLLCLKNDNQTAAASPNSSSAVRAPLPICVASASAFIDKTFGATVSYLQGGEPRQTTFTEFLIAKRMR